MGTPGNPYRSANQQVACHPARFFGYEVNADAEIFNDLQWSVVEFLTFLPNLQLLLCVLAGDSRGWADWGGVEDDI